MLKREQHSFELILLGKLLAAIDTISSADADLALARVRDVERRTLSHARESVSSVARAIEHRINDRIAGEIGETDEDLGITRCSVCGEPAHATETDDDDRCADCAAKGDDQ
ncbi:MAG: hypothetical protein KJO40_13610 [Deltaproteobacteria bacterium]|nr:hypothetical protein [Deltaproteobacteria bacterium]